MAGIVAVRSTWRGQLRYAVPPPNWRGGLPHVFGAPLVVNRSHVALWSGSYEPCIGRSHCSGLTRRRGCMTHACPSLTTPLTRRRLLQRALGGTAGLAAWYQ